MEFVRLKKIDTKDVTNKVIEEMATVLCGETKEAFDSHLSFWKKWFDGSIPGLKMTFVAEMNGEIVGVTRFWESPYCDFKWFNEGLVVIASKRGLGIGKSLVQYGLTELKNTQAQELYANISQTNEASIRLHESIGFAKVSRGCLNSYGDFRAHIDQFKVTLL